MNKERLSVDWLMYSSYAHNRVANPDISPLRWAKVYKDAIAFEEIFQENQKYKQEKGPLYVTYA